MRRNASRSLALRRLVPLALVLGALLAAPAGAEIPWRPYGNVLGGVRVMAVGPDGTLWFNGGGELKGIRPDGSETVAKGLDGFGHDLAIDAEGNFWEAGPQGLARMSPTGQLTQYPLPQELGEPSAIAAAPDGVWFVSWRLEEGRGGPWRGTGPAYAGRVAADGRVESFPLPGDAGARFSAPPDIALGADGSLWVADQALGKIDRVSPGGQTVSFELPSAPESLAAGPDGAIWYVANRQIGRISPAGEVTEIPLPVGAGTKIVAGSDGNLWVGGWSLLRVTPWGQVSSFSLGSTVSELVAGRDASIWVGTNGNPIKWVPGWVLKLPTGLPGVEIASAEAVVRAGRLALVLECGGSPTLGCAGEVKLGPKGGTVIGSYSIPPESSGKVQLRLPASARQRLAPERYLRERFAVTVEGGEDAFRAVVLQIPRPLRREVPAKGVVQIPLPDEVALGALTRGHGGDLWFADRRDDRIVRMTARGKFRSYRLPRPVWDLKALTAGPQRSIWFLTERTKETRNYVALGRLTSKGEFTEVPLPDDTPGADLVAGRDGNLWVTRDANGRGEIDRVTPQGEVTRFPVREPNSIVRGPGGLWFTTDSSLTIGRITPGGEITRFRVPGRGSVRAIAAGPDGNVWFTHGNRKGGPTVGRVTPRGKVVEFPIHRKGNHGRVLGSLAAGPDGNLWFAESYPPRLNRVTPRGRVANFPLPTGVEDPADLLAGPGGDLWFGQGRSNEVGVFGLPGRGGTCPARSVPESC